MCEALNTIYATNGTPCVNDSFLATEQALTVSNSRTRRYRFRSPFAAGNTSVNNFEIVVYAQWRTARLDDTWEIAVDVNGVSKNVQLVSKDVYTSGIYTRGAFTLGTYTASALVVQEVSLGVHDYDGTLDAKEDHALAVCIIPVRTRSSILAVEYPRDVYALPQDEIAANKAAATWQIQWARRMAEALYQDRDSNLYTSTQQFNEDTTASGFFRPPGLQAGLNYITQVISVMSPRVLPGVTQLEAHVWSRGGGTLQLVSANTNTTASGSTLGGWTKLTVDISGLTTPFIYFGVLDANIQSLCVFESTASLP